jgi:hypothetical protein
LLLFFFVCQGSEIPFVNHLYCFLFFSSSCVPKPNDTPKTTVYSIRNKKKSNKNVKLQKMPLYISSQTML